MERDHRSPTGRTELKIEIDTHHLGRPIGDLRAYEDEIRRALGRLFTGS